MATLSSIANSLLQKLVKYCEEAEPLEKTDRVGFYQLIDTVHNLKILEDLAAIADDPTQAALNRFKALEKRAETQIKQELVTFREWDQQVQNTTDPRELDTLVKKMVALDVPSKVPYFPQFKILQRSLTVTLEKAKRKAGEYPLPPTPILQTTTTTPPLLLSAPKKEETRPPSPIIPIPMKPMESTRPMEHRHFPSPSLLEPVPYHPTTTTTTTTTTTIVPNKGQEKKPKSADEERGWLMLPTQEILRKRELEDKWTALIESRANEEYDLLLETWQDWSELWWGLSSTPERREKWALLAETLFATLSQEEVDLQKEIDLPKVLSAFQEELLESIEFDPLTSSQKRTLQKRITFDSPPLNSLKDKQIPLNLTTVPSELRAVRNQLLQLAPFFELMSQLVGSHKTSGRRASMSQVDWSTIGEQLATAKPIYHQTLINIKEIQTKFTTNNTS